MQTTRTASLLFTMLLLAISAARAQNGGDIAAGHTLAREVCSACHAIERGDRQSRRSEAPSFEAVRETPGMTETALYAFFQTSHRNMPNIVLDPTQIRDVTAYIMQLK